MPVSIDPSLPDDVQVLIKSAYHLCRKAEVIYSNDLGDPRPIGYRVPSRELDRIRSKVNNLTGGRHD